MGAPGEAEHADELPAVAEPHPEDALVGRVDQAKVASLGMVPGPRTKTCPARSNRAVSQPKPVTSTRWPRTREGLVRRRVHWCDTRRVEPSGASSSMNAESAPKNEAISPRPTSMASSRSSGAQPISRVEIDATSASTVAFAGQSLSAGIPSFT